MDKPMKTTIKVIALIAIFIVLFGVGNYVFEAQEEKAIECLKNTEDFEDCMDCCNNYFKNSYCARNYCIAKEIKET